MEIIDEPKPGRRRWWGGRRDLPKPLLVLGCLAGLIVLFYGEEDWRGQRAWEQFKTLREPKGEHLDLASLAPAPVPDDQNFALTPVVAGSYGQMLDRTGHEIRPRNEKLVNRLTMNYGGGDNPPDGNGDWTLAKKTDFKILQKFFQTSAAKANLIPVSSPPQNPAADVLLALQPFNATIEDLRRAGQLPYSRFPLEYDKDDPAEMLLPHLVALKSCSRVLTLRVLAELQTGRSDLALADLQLMQRLTDSVRSEPILISQLIRIRIVQMMLQAIWEGLAEHRWSEPQLTELDTRLKRFDFLADYQLAMSGETAIWMKIIHHLKSHPGEYYSLLATGDENQKLSGSEWLAIVSLRFHLVPAGWFYKNQVQCAHSMEEYYLPAAEIRRHSFNVPLVQQGMSRVENERQHPSPYNFIGCHVLPGVAKAAPIFAHCQSSVDQARVAVALERYRLAQGKFPDSLAVLEPQYLKKLPHDVIGGQALNYRLTNDGQFVLYSVGWNESDEGGEVVYNKGKRPTQDLSQGDWVWWYPAK